MNSQHQIASTDNAEHYQWGGPNAQGKRSEGWHLVKTPNLSVIQERVPPGCAETPHYHQHAEQFFFVLEGTATIELQERDEKSAIELNPKEGLHIPAGTPYQLRNEHTEDLVFTVTSTPPSHSDRVIVKYD